MTEHEVSRTLVKSPPELWAECSEAASLARHLGGFGEIRITRVEPETAVAWEGEDVSGTVRLEPAGWGTRVILTAQPHEEEAPRPEPVPEPRPEPDPRPLPVPDPLPPAAGPRPEPAPPPGPPPRGWLGRVLALLRPRPGLAPAPPPPARTPPAPPAASPPPVRTPPAPPPAAPEAPDAPEPSPPPARAPELLSAALDSLGQAHHRPFSRS